MDSGTVVAIAIGLVAALLLTAGAVLVAVRSRRPSSRGRGRAGSAIAAAMAAYDEAVHTTAHARFVETEQQRDAAVPRPAPEDRPPTPGG